MSTPVYKVLLFLKRRPGMSVEEFRRYYEEKHVPLALKYIRGVSRYQRRFVDELPNPDGDGTELAYDVVTELWYEDEAAYRTIVDNLSKAVLPEEVLEDEKKLFDRPKNRMATVVEYETDLDAVRAAR